MLILGLTMTLCAGSRADCTLNRSVNVITHNSMLASTNGLDTGITTHALFLKPYFNTNPGPLASIRFTGLHFPLSSFKTHLLETMK